MKISKVRKIKNYWIFTLILVIICSLMAVKLTQNIKIAFAQACPQSNRADSLITAGGTIANTGFGNSINSLAICIQGSQATFNPSNYNAYGSYKRLYDLYVANYRTTASETLTNPITAITHKGVYVYKPPSGNWTITSSFTGNFPAVIFVDGDLTIGPMTPAIPPWFTYGNSTSGIVFIVRGKIDIDQSVTRIQAVLIAQGQNQLGTGQLGYSICTTSDAGNCPLRSSNVDPFTTNNLQIEGTLVALNASSEIRFNRNTTNNALAAEYVLYQAKYLPILNDVLSKNLTVINPAN
jgi:hypothetical protein